jgi:diguanylate cyclase (GGDEF)-like protein
MTRSGLLAHRRARGVLGFRPRFAGRSRVAGVTAALALVLTVLAGGIVVTQRQSRSHVVSTLRLRGVTSATFVSTFVEQQADREQEVAKGLLSGSAVRTQSFETVVRAFGSNAAVLLNSSGRLLAVAPADPALLGHEIATRYPHLRTAELGSVGVSNVVPSAARGLPVAAIAVPFGSSAGRRVLSIAYDVSGTALAAFVDHAISYRQHEVFLIDAAGKLLAASPRTNAQTLAQADAALARAIRGSGDGSLGHDTFTVARVPGTSWSIVISVPDSRLFAAVSGWAEWVPWIVFAIVCVFALVLATLFMRVTSLSEQMAASARTDALTGLANRRALDEHLTRAMASSRRTEEPLSILMIDLDRFKETNDHYGHRAGDHVLVAVAECMREVLRGSDLCGRWGGDEFLVVMLHSDKEQADVAAARLQQAASERVLDEIGLARGISLSVGSATATGASPEELIHSADLALYQAKAARTMLVGRTSDAPSALR